ncbi:MAG TPA: acyltransferase [Thermoanaerobaculia bacterium]|jgi:acetyltransferase-like isoleucine patch superfamily enzyme|nr:acyltransferase [Thermoanaerobaculia bacterium]
MAQNWYAHPTAIVEEGAVIGDGTRIWHFAHVRSTARIGSEVNLGKDVYIDGDVTIGNGARVQNGVSIYHGVHLADWVFVGPYVVFTNDMAPRVGNKSWKVVETNLETGASLGAGTIVRCGVTIGAFAMIGAGAIVTHDIPAFHLAVGVPARPRQKVCACGQTFLPIGCDHEPLIRDCCRDAMDPRVRADAERLVGEPAGAKS